MKLPLIPLTAVLLLFSACERSGSALGEAAVRELGELQFACTAAEGEMTQEFLELFARVQATGDVRQVSAPHRMTLLHLAALHKKLELVRDLLRAGADANARTLLPGEDGTLREGDPVLGYALAPLEEAGIPASTLIPLIDMLAEAGADLRALDAQGLPLLVIAAFNPHPTAEDVFMHLLARGAVSEGKPRNEFAAQYPLGYWVAGRCWPRALAALLDKGHGPDGLLAEVAGQACTPAALDCARLLLARGAMPGDCGADGVPALYAAARALAEGAGDEAATAQARAMVLLLLRAGADASQPCGAESGEPGACAADLLRQDAGLPALLTDAGLPALPPLALDLSGEGEDFLAQVCRAGRLDHEFGDDVLAPHAEKLAGLLAAPTEAMRQSLLYPLATGEALRLLARVDAPRAVRLLAEHPCWKEADWGEKDSVNAVLLTVAENEPRLVLPAHFLMAQAVEREAAGQPELAAAFIELLARDESAAATIERLCGDGRLALRVGAWTARLLREGLPAPRNGCVADWAAARPLRFEDAAEAVQTAWLATSLEDIWLGEADAARRDAIIAAMRRIGAVKAADFYAEPGAAAPQDMMLELEELTAKHIWENRAQFTPNTQPQA